MHYILPGNSLVPLRRSDSEGERERERMEGRGMENQRKRSVIHLDPNLPNCNNKHSAHKTKSALSFVTHTHAPTERLRRR